MPLNCFREDPDSNLRWDIGCTDWVFHGSAQSIQVNGRMTPWNTPGSHLAEFSSGEANAIFHPNHSKTNNHCCSHDAVNHLLIWPSNNYERCLCITKRLCRRTKMVIYQRSRWMTGYAVLLYIIHRDLKILHAFAVSVPSKFCITRAFQQSNGTLQAT
jgi:hypothetical protein